MYLARVYQSVPVFALSMGTSATLYPELGANTRNICRSLLFRSNHRNVPMILFSGTQCSPFFQGIFHSLLIVFSLAILDISRKHVYLQMCSEPWYGQQILTYSRIPGYLPPVQAMFTNPVNFPAFRVHMSCIFPDPPAPPANYF